MKEEILFKLQDIFRDVFDDEELRISKDMDANDIDEWDSLNQINIVVLVEKEFNVKFNLAEVEALKNIGDMIELIINKMEI